MPGKKRFFIVLNEQFTPPKEFTERRLLLSTPTGVNEHDRNSLITIAGIPGKGYYGEVDVYYNRLNIAEKVPTFTFRSVSEITPAFLIQTISNLYGVDIEEDDFEPFSVPVLAEGESLNLTVSARPNSLQWTGSIDLIFEYGMTWLDVVVGITTLDVYNHPYEGTKIKARMATWGLDFSGIQHAIIPDYKGEYPDWDLLRLHCDRLGIPTWAKERIADKAVSAVPDANPAFERVVIQSSVQSGYLVGPIYLHYNPI